MPANWVSAPTAAASTISLPSSTTVPPTTLRPGCTRTGVASPVIALMSTAAVPATTSPSAAMVSPGRTTKVCCSASSSAGMVISLPSASRTHTSLAVKAASARNAAAGLRLRPRLEIPSGQHEYRNAGGDLEVDGVAARQRLPHAARFESAVREEHGVERPDRGRGDAHRDQRLHRCGAVARVTQRDLVERPGCPGDDRRGQRGQRPFPAGEPGAGHHGEHHGQVGDRDEQHRRDGEPAQQIAGRGRDPRRADRPGASSAPWPGSRLAHHLAQIRGVDGAGGFDGGDAGGEVHRRVDAVDFVERGLHPRGARSARHCPSPRAAAAGPVPRPSPLRPRPSCSSSARMVTHSLLVASGLRRVPGDHPIVSGAWRTAGMTTDLLGSPSPPDAVTAPLSTNSSGPPSATCGGQWHFWPTRPAPTT